MKYFLVYFNSLPGKLVLKIFKPASTTNWQACCCERGARCLFSPLGWSEYPNLPSASNSIWLPWLQQQPLICGIDTQTPEMPESWRPDYSLWRQTFEKYDVNSETIVV